MEHVPGCLMPARNLRLWMDISPNAVQEVDAAVPNPMHLANNGRLEAIL